MRGVYRPATGVRAGRDVVRRPRPAARDQEGLNVVESWNRVNAVIFYGKSGEFATSRRDQQELGMLALHIRWPIVEFESPARYHRASGNPSAAARDPAIMPKSHAIAAPLGGLGGDRYPDLRDPLAATRHRRLAPHRPRHRGAAMTDDSPLVEIERRCRRLRMPYVRRHAGDVVATHRRSWPRSASWPARSAATGDRSKRPSSGS
jgi:Tn3 transposase DDE domain